MVNYVLVITLTRLKNYDFQFIKTKWRVDEYVKFRRPTPSGVRKLKNSVDKHDGNIDDRLDELESRVDDIMDELSEMKVVNC